MWPRHLLFTLFLASRHRIPFSLPSSPVLGPYHSCSVNCGVWCTVSCSNCCIANSGTMGTGMRSTNCNAHVKRRGNQYRVSCAGTASSCTIPDTITTMISPNVVSSEAESFKLQYSDYYCIWQERGGTDYSCQAYPWNSATELQNFNGPFRAVAREVQIPSWVRLIEILQSNLSETPTRRRQKSLLPNIKRSLTMG